MSTCNRLDLQTLGFQPIMSKNLPDHCMGDMKFGYRGSSTIFFNFKFMKKYIFDIFKKISSCVHPSYYNNLRNIKENCVTKFCNYICFIFFNEFLLRNNLAAQRDMLIKANYC